MKKSAKVLTLIIALLLTPRAVAAEEHRDAVKSPPELAVIASSAYSHNPSFIMKWDYDDETGALLYKKIVFPDGTEDEVGDDYIMVMTDGCFRSNGVKTVGGAVILPIGVMARNLGEQVTWNGSTSTADIVFVGGDSVSVRVGSDTAIHNGKEVKLAIPAAIISDRVYVPAAFAAEVTGARLELLPKNDESFAKYPIITLDAETPDAVAETKTAAEESSAAALAELRKELLEKDPNINEDHGYNAEFFESLDRHIGSPAISGEISRYWILKDGDGFDMLLRDKYNGNLFVFRGYYGIYAIEPLTLESFWRVFFTN